MVVINVSGLEPGASCSTKQTTVSSEHSRGQHITHQQGPAGARAKSPSYTRSSDLLWLEYNEKNCAVQRDLPGADSASSNIQLYLGCQPFLAPAMQHVFVHGEQHGEALQLAGCPMAPASFGCPGVPLVCNTLQGLPMLRIKVELSLEAFVLLAYGDLPWYLWQISCIHPVAKVLQACRTTPATRMIDNLQ